MQGKIFGLALTFVAATTARADVLRDAAAYLFAPLPSTVPAVHYNRVTPAKIALGKALFFDPRLSASGVFSCSSCHNLATGGDDNLETSIGHGWQKGPRNTPTVLNAVLNEAQFWDGRAEDLKAQVKVPMTPGAQMSNTPENVVRALKSMPAYAEWFGAAFPDSEEPVNFDNMAKALEAFEATLITPAPFDSWLTMRGLRTLFPRMEQQQINAMAVANFLENHPAVAKVHFPGLPSDPGHAIASRQQRGFGAMLSFDLQGGIPAVRQFLKSVQFFTLAESLGGIESLVAHPATMTHADMGEEARAVAGISDSLLRLSIGLEAEHDLLAGLELGLTACRG